MLINRIEFRVIWIHVDSIFFLKTNISSRAVHVRNAFFSLGMNHVDGVPFLLFWLPYGLLSFITPFFPDDILE